MAKSKKKTASQIISGSFGGNAATGGTSKSNSTSKSSSTSSTASGAVSGSFGGNAASGGGNFVYTASGATPYMDMYNNYANTVNGNYEGRVAAENQAYNNYLQGMASRRDDWRNQQQSAYNAQVENAGVGYNNSRTDTNAGYDNSARQNYINYMRAQKNLPDQLNSLGIRGGASESSLIRLGSNYGTNVANNESARQTALNELERQYKQALFDYEQAYNKALSDYDTTYNEQIASYNDTHNRALSELEADKANTLLQAYQTALENDKKAADEAAAKDLEQFAGYIGGLYKTTDGYLKLIAQLEKSNDPNKQAKIGLARQAMNALEDTGSSSGGGSSRRSYSSSYGGSGSTETEPTAESDISTLMNAYRKQNYKSQNRSTNDKTKTKTWKKYGTPEAWGRWVG